VIPADLDLAGAAFGTDTAFAFAAPLRLLPDEVERGFEVAAFRGDSTSVLAAVLFILLVLGFADTAALADTTFAVGLEEARLERGFDGAAFFFDDAGSVVFELLDLSSAAAAFLLAAIWDLNSFTAVSAFSSFFLVFDSCAFSFFFFICNLPLLEFLTSSTHSYDTSKRLYVIK